MKKPVWFALGIVVAVGAVVLLTRPPAAVAPVAAEAPADVAQPQSPLAGSTAAVRPSGKPAAAPSARPSQTVVDLPETAPAPGSTVHVQAGRALATVDGKSIELKDLIPLEANEAGLTMTPEEYQSRLDRAIEMELTFQAAAAQGVELTAEQKQRLDGLAQKRETTLERYKQQGITWSSGTAAQYEFEKRVTSALLLQQNLVAKAAPVAPSSDAGTQARYEQVRRELLGRLKANGNVNISTAAL